MIETENRTVRNMARHPWASFLHELQQPARYVGGEYGSSLNPGASSSIALFFPDVYEVGMSHLGTHILYSYLSGEKDICVERAFSPWPDLEAELRARNLPMVSLETWRPLDQFDVIGFSLQHELCYSNVLAGLDLSRIPLRTGDRDDSHPIILGGGPCASHPEPVAPFFDAFFIGEAEASLAGIVRTVGRMRRAGAVRAEILKALSDIPGIYVPSFYAVERDGVSGFLIPKPAVAGVPSAVKKVVLERLDDYPIPTRSLMPWNRAVFDRVSMEIARGCSEGCRFCEAGFSYRPLRDRDPARVLCDSMEAIRQCGYEEISLGSLSPADYPALPDLVSALSTCVTPMNVTLSVSSLRAYGLSEKVLADMKAVRTAGLTLAPEAGSQRLRDVINKNISEEDLFEAARRAFKSGWQRLKLYFMLGLPTETEEDVFRIVDLARRVLKLGRGMGRADVNAAVGVFVPRPHTPFQWEGMADPEEVRSRQRIIREGSIRTNVSFKWTDQRLSRLECVLARGDRSVADAVEQAYRDGCRFDNWTETFQPEKWDTAFVTAGIDPEPFRRPVPHDGALPWDMADLFVSKQFLQREWQKSVEALTTAPCEKPRGGGLGPHDFEGGVVCHNCGVGCNPAALSAERGRTAVIGTGLAESCQSGQAADASIMVPGSAPAAAMLPVFHFIMTKTGSATWLSQIDMVKHVPRIFKRAGYEPVFSGGFHPMPKFSYCEPMSVGYQSVGEWVDARLIGSEVGVLPDLDRLNASSVDGIRFLSVCEVSGKRGGFRPSRFAFSCPADPATIPGLLGNLDGGPVSGMLETQGFDYLNPCPLVSGEVFWSMLWPKRADRPAEKAHEWLSSLFGRAYVPTDLVRLYDNPRACSDASDVADDSGELDG